jgi:cyclic pyranopterin phosphate synthase
MVPALHDRLGRPMGSLRVSVTDRCNIRCAYCMPEAEYTWLPRADLLTFEEIVTLVDVATSLGVSRVRLTGGEPLLRRDLPTLVAQLAARPAIVDLALTTNGVLLADQAEALARAGLHRITVSLDTLRPDRFEQLTRRPALAQTLAGIEAAGRVFGGLKLDTVLMRGVNDDEMADLVEFAKAHRAELRFIEYMDVGGATRWSWERVVTRRDMLETLSARYGRVEAVEKVSSAPADRYRLPDGTIVGIISSTTEPFCADCDRVRLTADGHWFQCLYATKGLDLRTPLRAGATGAEIQAMLERAWAGRADQGAVERLRVLDRGALATADDLRRAPHLEMHTRGG